MMKKEEIASKKEPPVVVITGTTQGIGYYLLEHFVNAGWRVILANRSERLARKQSDNLKVITNNLKIDSVELDLSSLKSVRQAASDISRLAPQIDVLINNAGDICKSLEPTEEGLEKNIATNHLGPFLLTWLLLDNLSSATAGRIVTVASDSHFKPCWQSNRLDFASLPQPIDPVVAYTNAKLASVACTLKLANLIRGTSITANCLHPGRVATRLRLRKRWWLRPVWWMARHFYMTPARGARTTLFLATDEAAASYNGRYLNHKQQSCAPSSEALSVEFQDMVWLESKRLVGVVDQPDPRTR